MAGAWPAIYRTSTTFPQRLTVTGASRLSGRTFWILLIFIIYIELKIAARAAFASLHRSRRA